MFFYSLSSKVIASEYFLKYISEKPPAHTGKENTFDKITKREYTIQRILFF